MKKKINLKEWKNDIQPIVGKIVKIFWDRKEKIIFPNDFEVLNFYISTLLLQVIDVIGLEELVTYTGKIAEKHSSWDYEKFEIWLEGFNSRVKDLNSQKKEIKERMGLK